MADVATLNLMWGPLIRAVVAQNPALHSLNDADNSVALVFSCPKDGTIDRVGVFIDSITGNPPAYNIGIVTVDTSGNPTADAAGGSAVESYDFVAAGWHWITLTTPAVVNAGDIVAARIWPGASAPDGSNYVKAVYTLTSSFSAILQRTMRYVTSWESQSNFAGVSARYSDGAVVAPGYDTTNLEEVMDTGTTPDEAGNRFQIPFACQCVGAAVGVRTVAAGSDYEVCLYTDAGALLKSITVDQSQFQTATGANIVFVCWDPQSLAADTWYRLAVKPTSTSDVALRQLEVNEEASRHWFPEGERWYKCGRVDGGDFTDDATAIMSMAIILSQITVGNGGVGGAEPMAGLMIG